MKYTCKKCKHEYIHVRPTGSLQVPVVTNVPRNITDFLFLHDFKPIKSHGRIITHHNEYLKHILKNKYLQHTRLCSHEVLDVLDYSWYDNRVETHTKWHPIHNARSYAVLFVIRHMQSEQQHFQSTRSDYDRTETPRFFPLHFPSDIWKVISNQHYHFCWGEGDCKKKFQTLYSFTYHGKWVITRGCTKQRGWLHMWWREMCSDNTDS